MDTSKPKIFISHSGKDGPVRELLDALVERLKDEHEVLVDMTSIGGGQRYREPIDDMIHGCDAAIVIVSQAALDPRRSWVKVEAARLLDRARFDDALLVMPVFIEGTDKEDLRTPDWDPVPLAEQNPARGATPSEIVADVIDKLGPVREHVLRTPVERELARMLRKLPPKTLLEAAAPLFGESGLAGTGGDLPLRVAGRLIRTDWKTLRAVINHLAVHEDAEAILEFVLPFVWVDRDAAQALRAAVLGRATVWLNTSNVETSCAYVQRASPEVPLWRPFTAEEVVDPEDTEDLVRSFRSRLAHAGGEFDPELVEAFGDESPSGLSVLAIPCLRFDMEIVEAFAVPAFAHCAKLLMAGDVSWAEAPEHVREGSGLLQPELDRELERRSLKFSNAVRTWLQQARMPKPAKPQER